MGKVMKYYARIRGSEGIVRTFQTEKERDEFVARDPERRERLRKHRNSYSEIKTA